LFSGADFDKIKEKIITEKLLPKYELLHNFLGSKDFFIGDLSIIDFQFYSSLRIDERLIPDFYTKFPQFKVLK